MSVIKDGRFPIMLDKERHLLFSLNVIDEVQDKFGGYDKIDVMIADPKEGIKNLRWLLTTLINEGKTPDEEELTEKQVGRLIHPQNLSEVKSAVFAAFSLGNKGTTETDDEENVKNDEEDIENDEKIKNAEAGEVK